MSRTRHDRNQEGTRGPEHQDGVFSRIGAPGLALIALAVTVAGWLLILGPTLPERGSWGHLALAAICLGFFAVALRISRRERARLQATRERLEAARRDDTGEGLAREARRLLPRARAGWAVRQSRDRRD